MAKQDILTTLKFVRGAISTKNLLPELKHYIIKDGRVCGFNGQLALSAPIDFDVSCAPLAGPLVSAIGNCGNVTTLRLTDIGRLRVESGKFKAFIDCVPLQEVQIQEPYGDVIAFDGAHLMTAIEKLKPFIGNDASRTWTNGILLRGSSAFATNNVCLAEYWIGSPMPHTVNIPLAAIKEIERIGEAPSHAQLNEDTITFHYASGSWLRTTLYDTNWPDLSKVLGMESTPVAIPETLFEAIENVKPFIEKDQRIYFRNGSVCTTTSDDVGASYEVEGLAPEGIYNINMLNLLKGVADKADFTRYPAPVMFYGDRLRGAIAGQRS